MEKMFAVVYEDFYTTKILFKGSKVECRLFMTLNKDLTVMNTVINEITVGEVEYE